ncbi:capsule assembly Wzi family protein [Vibrio agarivorans]|uniref:capsule assembly Wzi family protein n=1 Tax=Vibrio agarivorans TaxID=153622 RepID=UPI0025B2ABF2|nr:capsule assembly Wzi family protein [Vibrio agarivorans]MDN3662180.1 capsule assembly Wzi family protein [Vibrio agarivorans]
MIRNFRLARALCASSTFLCTSLLHAAPWVNPDDIHLRADIQALSSAKVIRVPVTTYPLMWDGVINDMDTYRHLANSPMLKDAYQRVRRAHRNQQTNNVKLEMGGATEALRFQHFGTPVRKQGEVTAGYTDTGSWWSYNIEATYSVNAPDDEEVRLDNSYMAAIAGNWIFTAGYQQQWYGPGWDTVLLMGTNARPMPTVSITRHNPQAFEAPVLKWLGPWTLTTGFSWMDDDRYMEDTLLWTFRGTIRPHPNFEFGVTRAAQMCGNPPDGSEKSCDLDTFWRVLIGDTNVWSGENPANQIASFDWRWTDTVNGMPYSLYHEQSGEDNFHLGIPPFSKRGYIYGMDLTFEAVSNTVTGFIEYSDTQAWCNYSNQYNCMYEHSTYKSGYRYNGRSIGSTYDNDARTYMIGFVGTQHRTAHRWKANFRYLELNRDNSNRPAPGGNPVAPIGEDAINIDFSYAFPIPVGEIELGTEFTYSTYHDDIASDTNLMAWGQWSHKF